jgi:hypothetical protein
MIPSIETGWPKEGHYPGLNLVALLADVAPYLVKLDPIDADIPHKCVVELCAAYADGNTKAHDRVSVNASQPLGGTDRTAFGERGDNGDLFFASEYVHGAIHDCGIVPEA